MFILCKSRLPCFGIFICSCMISYVQGFLAKAALEIFILCKTRLPCFWYFLFVLVWYLMCKASLYKLRKQFYFVQDKASMFWYLYLFLYDILCPCLPCITCARIFSFVQSNLPYFNQYMFLLLSSLYYNFK